MVKGKEYFKTFTPKNCSHSAPKYKDRGSKKLYNQKKAKLNKNDIDDEIREFLGKNLEGKLNQKEI